MAIELKPCPFCGKTVAVCCTVAEAEGMDETAMGYKTASLYYTVVCDFNEWGCGASIGRQHKSPEEAIEAWNRRANDGEKAD